MATVGDRVRIRNLGLGKIGKPGRVFLFAMPPKRGGKEEKFKDLARPKPRFSLSFACIGLACGANRLAVQCICGVASLLRSWPDWVTKTWAQSGGANRHMQGAGLTIY